MNGIAGNKADIKTVLILCYFRVIINAEDNIIQEEDVPLKKYILALDVGTTSTRSILFDHSGNIVSTAQKEFNQKYPKPGWVEHDPVEIYASLYSTMTETVVAGGIDPAEIAAVGITNQRETTVVWDKITGKPLYNAIVWQCRRTASICEDLKNRGLSEYVKKTTGLLIDAYFSATKIKWILDNVEGARERAERGELLFGTIDTWIVWKLTGGAVHVTDYTNASRTMLFNIHTMTWDDRLLDELDIPRSMLPEVRSSSEIYGYFNLMGADLPISGIAGDQQAALFGQCCFEAGDAKNTYGTGCFLLMNTADKAYDSQSGLVTTVVATEAGQKPQYALEGSVFVGGAVIKWLRDELGFIRESSDCEYFASKVADSGGVYVVPAFAGLGAPYWDMYARGTIVGLTRGSGRNHIIRAALEAIAYQSNDVIEAMVSDTGVAMKRLRVDGGASVNKLLMQFQADISGIRVEKPQSGEATALGAAYLAGLAVGFWRDRAELAAISSGTVSYDPVMCDDERRKRQNGWRRAVGCASNWIEE